MEEKISEEEMQGTELCQITSNCKAIYLCLKVSVFIFLTLAMSIQL